MELPCICLQTIFVRKLTFCCFVFLHKVSVLVFGFCLVPDATRVNDDLHDLTSQLQACLSWVVYPICAFSCDKADLGGMLMCLCSGEKTMRRPTYPSVLFVGRAHNSHMSVNTALLNLSVFARIRSLCLF